MSEIWTRAQVVDHFMRNLSATNLPEGVSVSADKASAHNYYLTTDPRDVNIQWLMDEIRQTYFGAKRTEEQMTECIRGSLVFSVFRRDYLADGFPSHRDSQVAFARVVTDGVLFGWLADFIVDHNQRGKGIGHDLMHRILEHHSVKGLTMNLGTRDAQAFYTKFGFAEASHMMRRSKQ